MSLRKYYRMTGLLGLVPETVSGLSFLRRSTRQISTNCPYSSPGFNVLHGLLLSSERGLGKGAAASSAVPWPFSQSVSRGGGRPATEELFFEDCYPVLFRILASCPPHNGLFLAKAGVASQDHMTPKASPMRKPIARPFLREFLIETKTRPCGLQPGKKRFCQ